MQTIVTIGGFTFYIEWNTPGTIGVDQHGCKWYDKDKPVCASKEKQLLCEIYNQLIPSLVNHKLNGTS